MSDGNSLRFTYTSLFSRSYGDLSEAAKKKVAAAITKFSKRVFWKCYYVLGTSRLSMRWIMASWIMASLDSVRSS